MCLLCPEQEHLQIDSPILMLEPERGCRWGKVSYFSAVALALHVIPVLHMTMCLHAVARGATCNRYDNPVARLSVNGYGFPPNIGHICRPHG